MTDYIVAIDLGTSHITGVVGAKSETGVFSVVACEKEFSNLCVRRGNINNLEETAKCVGSLLKKLEAALNGGVIEKIYVGVGGQSLHTIDHVEKKEIGEDAAVSESDLDELKRRCDNFKPDLLDVLNVAQPIYYLDGRREKSPVGVPCKHLEARYKLIVGRTSIRREIHRSIEERAGKKVAGIIVTPLALSDALLSEQEKELGCALVDFGAGVTSVSVFKNNELTSVSVIPLGGNLITRDLVTLQLTESLAEKLKKEHGSAILRKEDDDTNITVNIEETVRIISVNDFNAVTEGRAKEITENVYARISAVTDLKALGAGIVLTGGASELKRLPEMLMEKCKIKVRHSIIKEGLIAGDDDMLGNPLFMAALSIMLKGTAQCVQQPENELPPEPPVEEKPLFIREKPPKRGLGKWFKDQFTGDIFDEN